MRLIRPFACLALAALTLSAGGAGGCARRSGGAKSPVQAPVISSGPAPSEADCRQFAAALEKAMASADAAAADRLIDWNAMLTTATAGGDAPPEFRNAFDQGYLSAHRDRGLVREVIAAVSGGGSYQLLHVHVQEGQERPLFRLVLPNGGVNYHDWLLARGPGGPVRAVDLYVFLTGELLSQSIRRAYVPAAVEQSQGLLARLTRQERVYVQNLPKINEMSERFHAGQYREGLAVFEQLPPALKKDKNVLFLRLRLAKRVGDVPYAAALEALRRQAPNDPALDLVLIDAYTLKKQYAQALEAVDRVDKRVGGDPYLNVVRAGLYLKAANPAAARKAALEAVAEEPMLRQPYWTLVTISLRERNFDDTVKWLDALADKFHVRFRDLTGIPEYAEFVRSPQYKKWLKARRQKPGTPPSADAESRPTTGRPSPQTRSGGPPARSR